jgi:hypothetical protein
MNSRISNYLVPITAACVLVHILGAVSSVAEPQMKKESKPLEASEIVIKDEAGKARLRLTVDGLELLDAKGKTRIWLGVNDITSGLDLFDGTGNRPKGGVFINSAGDTGVTLGTDMENSLLLTRFGISLMENDMRCVELTNKDAVQTFRFLDQRGKSEFVISNINRRINPMPPHLSWNDEEGETRISIGGEVPSNENPKPSVIRVYDSKGKLTTRFP